MLGRFDNLQARFEALRTVGATPEVVQSPTPVTVPAAPVVAMPEAKADVPAAAPATPAARPVVAVPAARPAVTTGWGVDDQGGGGD